MEEQAREIRDSYRSFEQLLRVPTEQGSFGELSLDTILADQLPPDMYGLRQRIFDGKIPDASIRSTAGIICVDSKFPLDNYRRVVESDDPAEIEACRGATCAICAGTWPRWGRTMSGRRRARRTLPLPTSLGGGLLLPAARGARPVAGFRPAGVQVVSPLTLATKIELIKAGVHAKRLSEGAQQVRDDLRALSQRFAALDGKWQILYGTHLSNAASKAGDVDRAYRALREEFRRVAAVEDRQD